MTIQQLTVFIENKSGTLVKVLNLLKEANIQLVATTISDTTEVGFYRIICSEPERAYETLSDKGLSTTITPVFAIRLQNKVGSAADAISLLSQEGININYLYSFVLQGQGILIFRTDDNEKTIQAIRKYNLSGVEEKDLSLLV